MNFPKTTNLFPQVIHKVKSAFYRFKADFSTNPHSLLQRLIFYTVLITFPSNLAKHFLTPQSFVLGISIDYLIPTVYATELLIVVLLTTAKWKNIKNKKLLTLGLLFAASLLPSLAVSPFKLLSLYRFFEIILWLGFSFWVSENISWEERGKIFSFLGIGVLWVSFLALAQFIFQRSILGYWFFGEPVLYPSLPAIAETGFLGREVIRSYGTFPHPNVLGGVLSVILLWLFSYRLWFRFGVGILGLLSSLSRSAVASLLGGMMGILIQGLGLVLPVVNSLSFSRRADLLRSAWEMIVSSPLAGVGLGQFTRFLPDFGIPSGLTLFLQPVHNIFALIFAESGILAGVLFIFILGAAFWSSVEKERPLIYIAILQLVFLGMVDHYLYTLPQGMFLLFLTVGLAFSSSGGGE